MVYAANCMPWLADDLVRWFSLSQIPFINFSDCISVVYIEIGLKSEAYTPEAFAYKEYLCAYGHSVRLCPETEMSSLADVRIYFMGMRPWWKHGMQEQGKVVHEYQSLSIPPLSYIKDFIKKIGNANPSGRIFLNYEVRRHLSFSGDVPYIYRDMGVSRELYDTAVDSPEYDLLYCGTLAGRAGLMDELIRLSDLGLKILIVGSVSDDLAYRLSQRNNITLAGRLCREDLPQAFSRARAGLNYTPDVFPFNVQTSTKTLEYCASGLGLVSNSYKWVRDFSEKFRVRPLWLDQIKNRDDFDSFVFERGADLSGLEWSNVLVSSGLVEFLTSLVESD